MKIDLIAGARPNFMKIAPIIDAIHKAQSEDINITYSERAKENLLRENISPDTIFKIGSPLYEVYQSYSKEINNSKNLKRLSLEKEKYLGEYIALKTQGIDVHVMNKYSLLRLIDDGK